MYIVRSALVTLIAQENCVKTEDDPEFLNHLVRNLHGSLKPDDFARLFLAAIGLIRLVSTQNKIGSWELLTNNFLQLTRADRANLYLIHVGEETDDFRFVYSSLAGAEQNQTTSLIEIRDEFERQNGAWFRGTSLCVSFRDHHGFFLGGIVGVRCYEFTESELLLAQGLGVIASRFLELLRAFEILREMRRKIHAANTLDEISQITLQSAKRLLRAQQGNIQTQIDEQASVCDDSKLSESVHWGSEGTHTINIAADVGRRFSDLDRDFLRWIARHAASDFELVEHARELDRWEADIANQPIQEICRQLFGRIKGEVQIDGMIVYLLIPRTKNLIGVAGNDPKNNRNFDQFPYLYKESDESAATWAFCNGRFSCEDPWKDHRTNKKGLAYFGIKGSLFATPLGEKGSRFGSVVVWYQESQVDDKQRASILAKLDNLLGHVVNPLKRAMSAPTLKLQEGSARILRKMMRTTDLKENLNAILDVIQDVGFARIRLYKFCHGDTLRGVMSKGMDEDCQKLFLEERGYEIMVQENSYTKLMYEGVSRARRASEDFKPEDILARLYPIFDDNGELIPDSSADAVRKPRNMPWAEVPIISTGRLYGLIAADKLTGPDRWEQMLEADLDALDVLAQLAGRAFAIEEKRGMLVQANLRKFDEFVGPNEDIGIVERRILLFLTHGEQGLGFNRAFFFRQRSDGRYEFVNAVGSLTFEEHKNIAAKVRTMELSSVLRDASLSHDPVTNSQFRSFVIPDIADSVELNKVISYKNGSNDPSWIRDFFAKFQCTENTPSEILVARLATGGVMMVDRTWDDLGVVESDRHSLESFSRYAGQVLSQHNVTQQRHREIRAVIEGVLHELAQDWPSIRSEIDNLKSQLANSPSITTLGNRFDQFVDSVDELKNAFGNDEPDLTIVGATALQSAIENCRTSIDLKVNVQLVFRGDWSTWSVRINLPGFRIASRNLLRNALERPTTSKLECIAELHNQTLIISFQDNGDGFSKEFISDGGVTFRSIGEKRGLGISLTMVALARFAAKLKIENAVAGGGAPKVIIPLTLTKPSGENDVSSNSDHG
jgi:hypothetical protein